MNEGIIKVALERGGVLATPSRVKEITWPKSGPGSILVGTRWMSENTHCSLLVLKNNLDRKYAELRQGWLDTWLSSSWDQSWSNLHYSTTWGNVTDVLDGQEIRLGFAPVCSALTQSTTSAFNYYQLCRTQSSPDYNIYKWLLGIT